MNMVKIRKNSALVRMVTFLVITVLLWQNVAWASEGSSKKCLSAKSSLISAEDTDELLASMICRAITKNVTDGNPDDIEKCVRSLGDEFGKCRFSKLTNEVRIYLPSGRTIIRCFIKEGRLQFSIGKIPPPSCRTEKDFVVLQVLVFVVVSYFIITVVDLYGISNLINLFIKFLPSIGALLGGAGIGWWVIRQIRYGVGLPRKKPTYDLLSRIVPPQKEPPKKPISFAEYKYKVITGRSIKSIKQGIKLTSEEEGLLGKMSLREYKIRRYMLYYNDKKVNRYAGIVTIREMGRGIISVEVEWTHRQEKRQLPKKFVVRELANRNPKGIIFRKSDVDAEIMDMLLPNHSPSYKKESAKRMEEEVFAKLKMDKSDECVFFAVDRQDFKERRQIYFGSFKFSSLWKMAEYEHWIYQFASGLFFALVFSSIFTYAESIKALALYVFFEEYINLILTVIVAPLAALSIAKVIRLRWDPVRARHGRKGDENLWLSVIQNMRMGWKMIGTFKLLAYSRVFLSTVSILLIPAIGVVILGIGSAYIYLSLMFLKLLIENIIHEYEHRYIEEIAEVAILYNEAAKREGYAENFHNIDSFSEVFGLWIYACGLLIGYGIFASGVLTFIVVPLAILAAIAIPASSFLVPFKGRDYKNYLKMWGEGYTEMESGKVLLTDGVTMMTKPDNPQVVYPMPEPITDDFCILPWVEQLCVVIECAPGHRPDIEIKNPKFFRNIRAKKGGCVLKWHNDNLMIELVSREKPIDDKAIIIEEKPDGGCIIRFYPKKDSKTSETVSTASNSPSVSEKGVESDSKGLNLSCGTVCESGHEGSYMTLDEQLKRQFGELRRILGVVSERDLIEEADRAMVEYAKRFGIKITYKQLQGYRQQIKEAVADEIASASPRNDVPSIFFSIPETGTELFWVGNDYAGGHFNKAGTRIHISLPVILKHGIKAGIAIAKHDLDHIQGKGHQEDERMTIVREIAQEEEVVVVKTGIERLARDQNLSLSVKVERDKSIVGIKLNYEPAVDVTQLTISANPDTSIKSIIHRCAVAKSELPYLVRTLFKIVAKEYDIPLTPENERLGIMNSPSAELKDSCQVNEVTSLLDKDLKFGSLLSAEMHTFIGREVDSLGISYQDGRLIRNILLNVLGYNLLRPLGTIEERKKIFEQGFSRLRELGIDTRTAYEMLLRIHAQWLLENVLRNHYAQIETRYFDDPKKDYTGLDPRTDPQYWVPLDTPGIHVVVQPWPESDEIVEIVTEPGKTLDLSLPPLSEGREKLFGPLPALRLVPLAGEENDSEQGEQLIIMINYQSRITDIVRGMATSTALREEDRNHFTELAKVADISLSYVKIDYSDGPLWDPPSRCQYSTRALVDQAVERLGLLEEHIRECARDIFAHDVLDKVRPRDTVAQLVSLGVTPDTARNAYLWLRFDVLRHEFEKHNFVKVEIKDTNDHLIDVKYLTRGKTGTKFEKLIISADTDADIVDIIQAIANSGLNSITKSFERLATRCQVPYALNYLLINRSRNPHNLYYYQDIELFGRKLGVCDETKLPHIFEVFTKIFYDRTDNIDSEFYIDELVAEYKISEIMAEFAVHGFIKLVKLHRRYSDSYYPSEYLLALNILGVPVTLNNLAEARAGINRLLEKQNLQKDNDRSVVDRAVAYKLSEIEQCESQGTPNSCPPHIPKDFQSPITPQHAGEKGNGPDSDKNVTCRTVCESGQGSDGQSAAAEENRQKDWPSIISKYKDQIKAADSQDELKRLWRSVVLDVHPDRNPEDFEAANEAFKDIKEAMDKRTKAGFRKATDKGDLSGLPLWVYDLDFYEKERDGISGVEIMAELKAQKEKNSRDIQPQIDLVQGLVVGEIIHIELPVDITTRKPAPAVSSKALAVSIETTVIRAMVLKSLSDEGIIEIIPIETPFYGGGEFTPRVNISAISKEDLLLGRVTVVKEPLQSGDFSIKIGDQIEILLSGDKWLEKEPFWARATVVSNAWGSFTTVAHRPVSQRDAFYSGRGITLNRDKAEEMLAEGSLRLVTPTHINPEMTPQSRYDYSLTINTASNSNRFEAVVCEIVKAIRADSSHALHSLDLDKLELIVEQAIRKTLVQEFKNLDTRFDTKVSWHRVDRYVGKGLPHQKQVYRDGMFGSQKAPFSALPYLGGIALDRIQFGENRPRYPIKESKQVQVINIENADKFSNQYFQADGEMIHVYDYHALLATRNNKEFNFVKDGGFYILKSLQRFIDANLGPYRLIKYEYGGMLDDYERDGFYLETSEPLLPFQELPEDISNGEYWQERYRKNIEYLQRIHAVDPDFYPRIFKQVIDHVYNMIAAGLHMNNYGWHVDNWHITPAGEVKLFRLETFEIVGATNHIMPNVLNMAQAIVEWIVDFRKVFRDVDPDLEKQFLSILKEKPGLFYHGEVKSTDLTSGGDYAGRIEIPDPNYDERRLMKLEEKIGDALHYEQKNTLKKRRTMKLVPVLILEGTNLYRLRDRIIQELSIAKRKSVDAKEPPDGSPASFFSILTDPENLNRMVPITELAKRTGVSRGTIKQDMRILRRAGLVIMENRDGNVTFRMAPEISKSPEKIKIAQEILNNEYQKGQIAHRTKTGSERDRIVKKLIDALQAEGQKKITERFIDTVRAGLTEEKGRRTILALDTDMGNMMSEPARELVRTLELYDMGNIRFVDGDGNKLNGVIGDEIKDLVAKGVERSEIDVVIVTNKEKEKFDQSYNVIRVDDSMVKDRHVPIMELLIFALKISLSKVDNKLRHELSAIYNDIVGRRSRVFSADLMGLIRSGFPIQLQETEGITPEPYRDASEILSSV